MAKTILVTFCIFFCECVHSASYNQKQTGELNVQVDLNDIQIIALLKGKEDYVDYDYAYDYSEMTIKPPSSTKPKPLNHTSTVTAVIKVNDTTIPTASELPEASTTEGFIPTVIVDITSSTLDSVTNTVNVENITSTTTTPTACRQGFVRNDKGLCEFKLQNASNTLRQMVKLSQKLRRREN